MEISGLGSFSFCTACSSLRPFDFKAGGLKLLYVTERKRKGGKELHYFTKQNAMGAGCMSCCLITVELFRIEAAAVAEYF